MNPQIFQRRSRRFAGLFGALALATGCPTAPSSPISAHGPPLEVAGTVVLANAPAKRFDVIAVDSKGTKLSQLPYTATADVWRETRDDSRALLLDTAHRTLTTTDGKTAQVFALPAEFGDVAGSEDGTAAVLWHPSSGAAPPSIINTDEVALVALLAKPGKDNPVVATLSGLGRSPLRARATATLQAADGAHRLLWVEAAGRLGLADLGPAGKVRTKIVPLAADPQSQIAPIRTEVRTTPTTVDLYLLAAALNDVVHVHIELAGAELVATVDQVAAGAMPVDLHLFDTKDGLRILTANYSGKSLALLDPATGSGLEIPLNNRVSKFVPVTGADGKARLLAWDDKAQTAYTYLVDVGDLTKKKGKALREVTFNASLHAAQAAAGFIVAELNGGQTSAALLAVDTGKITEFQGAGTLAGPTSGALWLLGNSNFQARLSRVDLATLHGDTLVLGDVTADALVRLGDSGVAVLGPGLAGYWVAAFPTGALKADTGQWLEGFGLTGLAEGGAP